MEAKLNWVIDYMKSISEYVDVMNADFVDEYIREFNPRHKVTNYGANKCQEIGRILKKGYDLGLFERKSVGIPLILSGFPKWVYVYKLKNNT